MSSEFEAAEDVEGHTHDGEVDRYAHANPYWRILLVLIVHKVYLGVRTIAKDIKVDAGVGPDTPQEIAQEWLAVGHP